MPFPSGPPLPKLHQPATSALYTALTLYAPHPPLQVSFLPEPSPTEKIVLSYSPAGALGAATSLAALSYTAAPGGVAGRVRCRRLAAAVTALAVDAASGFAAAVRARLGHQRLGR